MTRIMEELNVVDEEVAVLVNGLGSTPQMDLYILFRRVEQILSEKGITIYRSYVGDYITSLEMGGASITVTKLTDELKELIDHPVDCPAFTQK
ncbi:dihydroxyacetone kinase subunit DhaK [Alkalibacterium olivapovliticus]|uniref:Dak1 domain-containing protein n=1 Tax=Alkalibacterium olivapovliticus TaxID=99907 RepID=A0A2T0W6Z5_9LACT|nr:dihydroxyacetone kinase subunit DhaK [Alkalibacterium olivapovliticus]PRY82478.1 Dak1 domain-containing protein [Alkalibacterium olivapovliticus]